MKKTVAQLNHEFFFLYPAPTYGDGMPGGAIEQMPPETPLPDHHRWRWEGEEYTATPDYRGVLIYRPDRSSYYPETWGPLPEGDSITPPPPTAAELAVQRIVAIKAELTGLDISKVRPLEAMADGSAGIEEQTILAELKGRTDALREEMHILEAGI